MCAAQARAANTSALDPLTDMAAINADRRQIRFLILQAENAVKIAVSDGDMTEGDAADLRDLQDQGRRGLAQGDFSGAATSLDTACRWFE
jgi:hypothetical protein